MTRTRRPTEKLPWEDIVEQAVRANGKWVLPNHLLGTSHQRVRHIRDRRNPALHLEDGIIEAEAVGRFKNDDGETVCDVWIRFVKRESNEHEREEENLGIDATAGESGGVGMAAANNVIRFPSPVDH